MEKGLYAMPQGLAAIDSEPALEIVIEDPEALKINGMEIDLNKEDEGDFDTNLAEHINDGKLAELAGDILGDIDADISSRKDWMQTYVDGLELFYCP